MPEYPEVVKKPAAKKAPVKKAVAKPAEKAVVAKEEKPVVAAKPATKKAPVKKTKNKKLIGSSCRNTRLFYFLI